VSFIAHLSNRQAKCVRISTVPVQQEDSPRPRRGRPDEFGHHEPQSISAKGQRSGKSLMFSTRAIRKDRRNPTGRSGSDEFAGYAVRDCLDNH
jgi:hypothetical protein